MKTTSLFFAASVLLANASWAVGPGLLDSLVAFSGQGIPRQTEADCKQAGENLAGKLSVLGFEQIKTSCMGTSQDIGGWVPVVNARVASTYTTEQAIGSRLAAQNDCQQSLAQLIAGVNADAVLESECLQGTDTDSHGHPVPFFQPWATKLAGSGIQTAAHSGKRGHRTRLPATGASGLLRQSK